MGFRSGRSTTLAVTKLVKHINVAQNNNLLTAALYLDFSKAFDCLKPALLLHKLPYYGFQPKIISWIADYFTDRSQQVRIGDCYSSELFCTYGVPQGSILGPLSFILYINDIVNCRTMSKMVIYADDIVLYSSSDNWNSLNTTLITDLKIVYNWTLHNRLSINFSKSKLQFFGSKNKLSLVRNIDRLYMGTNALGRVTVFKYLGIILDEELKFEAAMGDAYSTISYRLYTLTCIRKNITRKTAIAIVKAMIMPYYDYVIFLSTACTQKTMTKLSRLLNRALRVALNVDRHTPVNSLYDQTNTMKLDIRCRFNLIKIMHILVYSPVEFMDDDMRTLITPSHFCSPYGTKFSQ